MDLSTPVYNAMYLTNPVSTNIYSMVCHVNVDSRSSCKLHEMDSKPPHTLMVHVMRVMQPCLPHWKQMCLD